MIGPSALTFAGRAERRRGVSGGLGLGLGLGLAVLLGVVALTQSVFAPADPYATDLPNRLAGPGSPGHLLGTDQLGRDLLSRVLAGFGWSLGIALLATAVGAGIGTAVGLLAGWSTGWPRTVLTRLVDLVISFPYLVIAIAIIAVVGRGFWPLALTLGLVSWPIYARVTYAETLSLRARPYVLAARLVGASAARTLVTHVLPGLRPTLQVLCALQFADMLVAESGLSFLGLGAPLGTPTWGNMLSDSRGYLVDAPWLLLAPATAIVLAVVAANLIGDGLTARGRPGLPPTATKHPGAGPANPVAEMAVELTEMTVSFPSGRGKGAGVPVVRGVSLRLRRGETLGLVGESGSGKTMLGLGLLRLVPEPGEVTGSVRIAGREILDASQRQLRSVRGAQVAMVFQDPMTALNPVRTIGSLLIESIRRHQGLSAAAARELAVQALRQVGVPAAEERMRAYPHTLSGGLRQRAMIALALVNSPVVLVADEPTTALDATIQAQLLDLLRERADQRSRAIILITHDLGVAAEVCDRIAVLYAGRIVEIGPTPSLLSTPRHPYTQGLLAARPRLAAGGDRVPLHAIPGQPPAPDAGLTGCWFAPRCPLVVPECLSDEPMLRPVGDVEVACIRAGDTNG
jgi:peptide/nickel transport system permease protein